MSRRPYRSALLLAVGLVGLLLIGGWAGAELGPGSLHENGASRLTSDGLRSVPHISPLTGAGYPVNFSETGLPAATNWSVTLDLVANYSTTSQVSFEEANGTFAFSLGDVPGFVASPSIGNVTVAGTSQAVAITFTPFPFAVTFTESGLPGATNWAVNLSGTRYASSTSVIVVNEGNGTYPYVVEPQAGFTVVPAGGNVTVNDAPASVPVAFSPILYAVVFSETGLNASTNWSVNLSGTVSVSNTTNLTFEEPNGTYAYSVGAVSGFHALPTSGPLTVSGAAVTTAINFTANTPGDYPLSFNETGLAPGTSWTVRLISLHGSYSNNTSTGPTIVFLKALDTIENFTIDPVPGYNATPAFGNNIKIRGPTYVPILFTPILYWVNFTETGLPGGTNWSVELGATLHSSTTTRISFEEANGTWAYAVDPTPGFRASPLNGSVDVVGASVAVAITESAVTYPVTWTETGLPYATHWSVTIAGTPVSGNGTQLAHSESNGTYPFELGAVPGFVAIPTSGNVTVDGNPVAVSVAFSAFDYPVTFAESGLPSGTGWSVTLAAHTENGTGATLGFEQPNGTYSYRIPTVPGFTVAPSSGNLTVAGAGVRVPLTYSPLPPGMYAVTFTETGLPSGLSWSVNLSGTVTRSTTDQVVFDETNGSYTYSVGPLAAYLASPSSGSVTVAGSDQGLSIAFSAVAAPKYSVTFAEEGLPTGTNWSVDLDGVLLAGTTSNLSANEPNGSYPFTVPSLAGFNASLASGTADVQGGPVVESVQFSALPIPRYPVFFVETGLPNGTNWTVTLNGTAQTSNAVELALGSLPAGNYSFTVRAAGYTATPSGGTVQVKAGPVTVDVLFTSGPKGSSTTPGDLSVPTLVFLGAMGLVVVAAIAIALATRGNRRGDQ